MDTPVQMQPQQTKWMESPGQVIGCPHGLEYLCQLDQILIHQQVELFEVLTNIETKNRYAIKNSLGQQCYFAYEESDLCMRICCKSARGFDMHIVDNLGQEVIRVNRPFKCCAGCCWCIRGECCAYTLSVEAGGEVIGGVRQMCSGWIARIAILNANAETVLMLQGPCCICTGPCCPADVPFEILTPDGSQHIGTISKQYTGVIKEMFSNATNFAITFPKDLDVKVKATLLAAAFLLDMMFFEYQNDQ